VLIEGPLDEASAQQVEAYGGTRGDSPSLVDLSRAGGPGEHLARAGAPPSRSGSHALLHQLAACPRRPWIGRRFARAGPGWPSSASGPCSSARRVDLPHGAGRPGGRRRWGKMVGFLETIEEQLPPWTGCPWSGSWRSSPVRLAGIPADYASISCGGTWRPGRGRGVFPTYCDSIIANGTRCCMGECGNCWRGGGRSPCRATHCRGLHELLRGNGSRSSA